MNPIAINETDKASSMIDEVLFKKEDFLWMYARKRPIEISDRHQVIPGWTCFGQVFSLKYPLLIKKQKPARFFTYRASQNHLLR